MKYWLSLLYFSWIVQISVCQSLLDIEINDPAKIVHSEVTNTVIDNNHNIWLGYSTSIAVSRFDGFNWHYYDFRSCGIPIGSFGPYKCKNVIYTVHEGNLLKPVISIYLPKLDKWNIINLNGKVIQNNRSDSDLMYIDTVGDVYKYNIEARSFKPVGFRLPYNEFIFPAKYNFFCFNQDTIIVRSSGSSRNTYRSFSLKYKKEITTPGEFIVENQRIPSMLGFKNRLEIDINGKIFPKYLKETPEGNLMAFSFSHDGTIKPYATYPNGIYQQCVLTSNNKSIFGTTHGLYKRDNYIRYFPESSENMVSGLHSIGEDAKGNIWFGGYNHSGWCFWDETTLRRPIDPELRKYKIMPGALSLPNGDIIFTGEESKIGYIRNGRYNTLYIDDRKTTGFYFNSLANGDIAFGSASKGLYIFENKLGGKINITHKNKGLLLDNILTIAEDKDHRIWMGRGTQGIALYDRFRDTAKTWLIDQKFPGRVGASSMIIDTKNALWMGTFHGLYKIDQLKNIDLDSEISDFIIEVPLPYPGDQIGSIKENLKYIFVGGKKALYILDKSQARDSEGRYRIYTLTFGTEILGDGAEQNAMILDKKGILWFGVQNGALSIDVDQYLFDTTQVMSSFKTIIIGRDTVFNIEQDSVNTLRKPDPSYRSLNIEWTTPYNEYQQDNVFYSVSIASSVNDTIFHLSNTRSNTISIPYLAPGSYQVTVKTYKNNQLMHSLNRQITINRFLSEQTWFWPLALLIVSLIPFLNYYYKNKAEKKELALAIQIEKSRREADRSRIKSLANFFNPHFINNSLQWIQSRFRKDIESASVIGSLADNIKIMFDNITKETTVHTLRKEIELVENYINIQLIRYNYEITVDTKYNITNEEFDVAVPMMIMQIHVENAVEKGIRKRDEASRLNISIDKNDSSLIINIEDDGAGRDKGNTSASQSVRRSSTKVMDDLIQVLNMYNFQQIKVQYEDRIFENSYGTRVVITIPKHFEYDIK